MRVDRWAALTEIAQKGRVKLQEFVTTFDLVGQQEPKKAAYRAGKRLRDKGYETSDEPCRGKGHRPAKVAKLADLKRCYPELR